MVHFWLGVQGCYGDGVVVLRVGPGGIVYDGIIRIGLEIRIELVLDDSHERGNVRRAERTVHPSHPQPSH